MIQDPNGTVSSSRVLALTFGIVGCRVALMDPSAWQTVGELVGGGAVSLILRVKGRRPSAGMDETTHGGPDA